MSIVSPGISHAFQYSVSPLYGISMRLFRRFIRESVFAQAGVDLVDFEYAQTRAGSCATSSSISLNSTNNVFNWLKYLHYPIEVEVLQSQTGML